MNVFNAHIISISNKILQNLVDLREAEDCFAPQKASKKTYKNKDKQITQTKSLLKNILALLNATALRIFSEVKQDVTISDRDCIDALAFCFSKVEYSFLKRFHKFIFALASYFNFLDASLSHHFSFVYEFLFTVRNFARERFNLSILQDLDSLLPQSEEKEYQEKIAEKLESFRHANLPEGDVFYVSKTKPFFVNGCVFYELTVRHAGETFGNGEKFTVFSKHFIPSFYAVKLSIFFSSIFISGREMRIRIADSFKVAIRLVEFGDLAHVLGLHYNPSLGSEYFSLMDYLTLSGDNLLDIIDLKDDDYEKLKASILKTNSSSHIFTLLDKAREIIRRRKSGFHTLRYLLFKMRHHISKNLIDDEANASLSGLFLSSKCHPFEDMPFDASLPAHNPNVFDLLLTFRVKGHLEELLSRKIISNTENSLLFTPLSSLKNFKDIKTLISKFNERLPEPHFDERKLIVDKGKVFANGYVNESFEILKSLFRFVGNGIPSFENLVKNFFESGYIVDSKEKADVLEKAFSSNRIIALYGSAGTGKTVFMNHLSHLFNNSSKLFLAKTNSAVEYMRKVINADNCLFKSVDSWLRSEGEDFDLLFIDECPSIDNRTMRKILDKISCKLIVLVGDLFQVESIRFGNWFAFAKHILPESAVFELNTPYRTNNSDLSELFNKTRRLDENLFDFLKEKSFVSDFDDSLFFKEEENETIICFDYDGLYGINNLNSFLQNNNAYVPEIWDSFLFKYGDPVVFADNNPYSSILHKNLKGKILSINKTPFKITFCLEVEDKIDVKKASKMGIEVFESEDDEKSVISLSVMKHDENSLLERTKFQTIPFNLAYALSVFKVQGMEFDSVKLIITQESLKNITPNLFYTAITRAKKKLKIFASESALRKLFASLEKFDQTKSVHDFVNYNHVKIQRMKKKKS